MFTNTHWYFSQNANLYERRRKSVEYAVWKQGLAYLWDRNKECKHGQAEKKKSHIAFQCLSLSLYHRSPKQTKLERLSVVLGCAFDCMSRNDWWPLWESLWVVTLVSRCFVVDSAVVLEEPVCLLVEASTYFRWRLEPWFWKCNSKLPVIVCGFVYVTLSHTVLYTRNATVLLACSVRSW